MPFRVDRCSLIVTHLLQPEAGGRGVEEAEQADMVVFRGTRRQLDDWRRLLEDLAAAVERKVVVRSDFAESDGERNAVTCGEIMVPAPPGLSQLGSRAASE